MITGKTKCYAIIGNPIEQALSPVLQNAAFQQEGRDAVFIGCPVLEGRLREAVEGVRALGIAGLSITMPYKTEIIPYLDDCEEKIACLGAVNVAARTAEGALIGYNTDGDGFVLDLTKHGVSLAGKHVLLFGAGGASKGICYSLLTAGIGELTVCNRSLNRAEEMLSALGRKFSVPMHAISLEDRAAIRQAALQAGCIFNSTSMGMNGSPSPHVEALPWEDVGPGAVFYEIIHKPLDTAFVQKARRFGFQTLTGDGMVLYQALLAHKLLTGEEASVDAMRSAIDQKLKEESKK